MHTAAQTFGAIGDARRLGYNTARFAYVFITVPSYLRVNE